MAYRTSLPLHPTEFKEKHKVKRKRKGGVKTTSLGTKSMSADIPHQPSGKTKDILRLKKTKSKSGKPTKVKAKSVAKTITGGKTKSETDDQTTYSITKTRSGKKAKTKNISQKKYKRKVKQINRQYNKAKGGN